MTETDWDYRAGAYNKLDWVNRPTEFEQLLGRAMDEAHPGKGSVYTAMDLGCGTGAVIKTLMRHPDIRNIIAVDISPKMLDQLPESLRIRKITTDINTFTEVGVPVNLVTARMLFHHIPNPVAVLRNIRGMMADNGVMVICEGTPPSHKEADFYTEIFKHKEERHTILESDLVSWLHTAGFNYITLFPYWLKKQSLRNWLNNSGTDPDKIQLIYDMHANASSEWKLAYNYLVTEDDILMDWKFVVAMGVNRE